jgi:DNA-binding NarL/FixJ family response regulator
VAPDDVLALVGQRFGRPADAEVAHAAMRSLGPLAGNPRALLSVFEALQEDAGLLVLDSRIRLSAREDALRLAGTAAELCRIACPGLPVEADQLDSLVALAHLTGAADFRLGDMHDMARWDPRSSAALARTVDRLVTHRVLTVGRAGSLSFAVPAFGAALRTSPVLDHLSAVHAGIVASAGGPLGPAAAGACQPRLAEHVMAAGPLADGETAAQVLLAAAGKYAGHAADRAVRAYLAALRHLPVDHPDHGRALRAAAELGLREADHAGLLALGEPLTAIAAGPGAAARTDLAYAAGAWGLAALYEHLPPGAAGAEPWAVVRRMPGGPELAALGGRYGIGSVRPGPSRDASPHGGTGRPAGPPGDEAAGDGLWGAGSVGEGSPAPGTRAATVPGEDGAPAPCLPSPAQLRLLAAAVVGGEALEAARRDLPPGALGDTSLESLRIAAGYGDLAGALATLTCDPHPATGNSVAERYHTMVGAYLAGRWDEALACARRIETYVRARGVSGTSLLARVLAAEIHCMRGEQARARAWLSEVPDTIVHPLGGQVQVGVRYLSGNPDEAFKGGWRDVCRARESGLLAGLDRLLIRVFQYGLYEDLPEVTHRAVDELEALHEESASPRAAEALTLARSVLRRDPAGVRRVHDVTRQRGDIAAALLCVEMRLMAGDTSESCLTSAVQEAQALGIRHLERSVLGSRARMYGMKITPPRRRAAGPRLGELDRRLVEMVGDGATNRQIAARLACSEKTVEQHLTKLFRQTGCRSRTELAAARLDGRLARLGLPPDQSARL